MFRNMVTGRRGWIAVAYRIVGQRQDDVQRGVGDGQGDAALGEPDGHVLHLQASDLPQLLVGQRVEDDDLVQPVQQLRPEVPPHLLHDEVARDLHGVLAHHPGEEVLGAEVGGHDDHGVPEVHRPALPVGQPAVVQHLEERVEHRHVRLLHLVEQDHAVRPPPHLLRQLPTLLVPNIARWRSDEAGDGVLLHVLGHVDADEQVLVVEQLLGEGLGELGLAHAGRAQEEERPGGLLRPSKPRPGPQHSLGDGVHGLRLPDHPRVQPVRHADEPLLVVLPEPGHRDAGPPAHHLRDLLRADGLGEHQVLAGLALQLGDGGVDLLEGAVLEVGDPGQVHAPLGLLQRELQLLAPLLQLPDLVDPLLLLPVLHGQRLQLVPQVVQLLPHLHQPGLAGLVLLLLQRVQLHLQLNPLPLQVVDLLRLAVQLHPHVGARLVHQVDGLVRQVPAHDVPRRELRRDDDGAVLDAHAVVPLVLLLEPSQDADGVGDARLGHVHLLEPPLERGVLLDVLAVLLQRGGADAPELAPGEHRLEQVGGVHGPLRPPGAEDEVYLVDEEDDLALGLLHLLEHGLEPLLELAAVLGAGDERAHVERDEADVEQVAGHVPAHDALREALHDGRLAHAGLADEDGVVLCAAGEDAHDAADLLVAADDGVELAGHLDEVAAVRLERLEVGVAGGGLDLARVVPAAELLELGAHPRGGHAGLLEAVGDLRVLEEAHEQLVDGEVRVPALLLRGLRAPDGLDERRGGRHGVRRGGLRRQLLERAGEHALERVPRGRVPAGRPRDRLAQYARLVRRQRRRQVQRRDLRVAGLRRRLVRRHQRLVGLVREVVRVHGCCCLRSRSTMDRTDKILGWKIDWDRRVFVGLLCFWILMVLGAGGRWA
uniref:Uncharacterized protein n=1 Tax=Aegilops tauschii subsp. strangulata TaxID=200361 RepID=A0A452ZKJ8_AEGTS